MKVLEDNMTSRNVKIHFNTPGKELIQDGKGNIIGVKASKEGKEINIMGKKVYVAGGAGNMGTEFSLDMAAHLDEGDISEMVIGDIDLSKAEALASQAGDKRVRAEYLDVTEEQDAVKNELELKGRCYMLFE